MTDSEKLDLLLVKVGSMENDISGLKEDVSILKRDYKKLNNKLNKSVKELKTMDRMILDEVERVHGILDLHKADKAVHTA